MTAAEPRNGETWCKTCGHGQQQHGQGMCFGGAACRCKRFRPAALSEPPAETQQEARQLEALTHGHLMDDISAAQYDDHPTEVLRDDDHEPYSTAYIWEPTQTIDNTPEQVRAWTLGWLAGKAARPSADTETLRRVQALVEQWESDGAVSQQTVALRATLDGER